MDISVSRPKVAQLTFQVLGRSVHPELFQTFKTRRIDRDAYRVVSHITSDGHVVACTRGDVTLTEIAASSFQLLPEGERLVEQPMLGSHKQRMEYSDDIRYEFEYGLERVPAEMFWMIQKQLGESRKNHEMIQEFGASGRIAIGGISFVNIETRLTSFRVQAIHTFPDDLSLLKTQSVFRFGDS